MATKKKLGKKDEIELETGYVAFLEKRLASENYKNNVAPEEYAKTQEKLKKARFKLKTLLVVKKK